MTLRDWLIEHNACRDAIAWAGGRDPETAWQECRRGDWLIWAALNAGVDKQKVINAVCDIVEPTLMYVPEGENMPPWAVHAAREEDGAVCDVAAMHARRAGKGNVSRAVTEVCEAAYYLAVAKAYRDKVGPISLISDLALAEFHACCAHIAGIERAYPKYGFLGPSMDTVYSEHADIVRKRIPLEEVLASVNLA